MQPVCIKLGNSTYEHSTGRLNFTIMDSIHADVLFRLADDMMANVEAEVQRADEDVVTHLVCFNSRQSIFNYMRGFLLRNNVKPIEPSTLNDLYDKCKTIDARFDLLDLSAIHCRCETHRNNYCLDRDQVDQCYEVAMRTREIVKEQAPGY